MRTKPTLSFWQIWNMSFGFLGIQFGFALQGGFMSSIFVALGAEKDEVPLLWLAAPVTGLIIQPIIGYMSDRTWHPYWGRRKPFFLVGALLASTVLFFVPHSSALWMAVGSLWILDASINVSMEPFRALVADKLPEQQRTYGFVVQTLVIGIGTWVASNLPWFVETVLHLDGEGENGVPQHVQIAFAIGAFVFLASILYTVFKTKEYSPEEMEAFQEIPESQRVETTKREGLWPPVMLKLGIVQFFSWFAFFTMWSFATLAIVEHVFDGDESMTAQAGGYMGTYGLSSMAFALILTLYTSKRQVDRRWVHAGSLLLGGIGFFSMRVIDTPSMLHVSYACIGVAWGSILSMPYAMLSSAIDPRRMGFYMGVFNMFIVIPQIVAALGGVNLLRRALFGEDLIGAMTLAGGCLVLGALSTFLISERAAIR